MMCILIKIFCIWRCEQGWQILFSLNNEWIQEFTYFHEDCCFINIHFWSQMISSLQLILKCVFLKKWHDSKKLLFFKFIIYLNMYPSWDVVLTCVPKEGNFYTFPCSSLVFIRRFDRHKCVNIFDFYRCS